MPSPQSKATLGKRSREVLTALIREYVATGRPVGSRRLAKVHGRGLSSATMRKVVAELEALGYVEQPHTSAGRIPTSRGYRFFVDSLEVKLRLPRRQTRQILKSLEHEARPDQLMGRASQILSTLSSNVGFVWVPPVSATGLKHIEFVRISRARITVILVTGNGSVLNRMVELDEDLSQSELDQSGRYLVEHFRGWRLVEIRDRLLQLLGQEKSQYDRLLRNVVVVGAASLLDPALEADEESRVYLGTTSEVIRKPEMADINRMICLFRTIEEKSRLVRIINECVGEDARAPAVTIGLESHLPGMADWSLVSSPYRYDDGVVGRLGVLGPSRMEYERAISLVDYVARLFDQLLAGS